MISGYLIIVAFFAGAILFVAFGYLASLLLQTKKPNIQKLSPYECGEEGEPMGKTSFHFRFYLPAIIFLLFEVEIVLFSPIFLAQDAFDSNWKSAEWMQLLKAESILFFVILATGYAFAISLKYFDWDKPELKPVSFEGPVPDFAYEQYNIEQERKNVKQDISA